MGQSFSLDGQTTLGRSSKNMIRLDDQEASRQHARISPQGGWWVLEDLGSRNGTFVNGKRLGQAVALRAGDEIEMGDTLLRVSGPGKVEPVAAKPVCSHCGQTSSEGAGFCRHCGQALS
jgi:pSer/pThr/pTyr-binding forkhead associated (FHA) protein